MQLLFESYRRIARCSRALVSDVANSLIDGEYFFILGYVGIGIFFFIQV
jgi:hypothetical protein